jgi:hypothetical protein
MSRTTTRWLMILGVLIILAVIAVQQSIPAARASEPQLNGGFLLFYAVAFFSVVVLFGAAFVGALIKLYQLQQFGWFWVLVGSAASILVSIGLVLAPFALLIYCFAGPTTPAKPTAAASSVAPLTTASTGAVPSPETATPTSGAWFGIASFASSLIFPVLVGIRLLLLTTNVPAAMQSVTDALVILQIPGILVAIVMGHLALTKANPTKANRGWAIAGLVLGYLAVLFFIVVVIAFAGL